MAGRRPKWQIFKTVKGKKIDYKNDKIGALWAGENQYGEFFTGKIGDDSVVVYANKFYNQEEDGPDGEGHERSTGASAEYPVVGNPQGDRDSARVPGPGYTDEYPDTADVAGQVPTDDDDLPF